MVIVAAVAGGLSTTTAALVVGVGFAAVGGAGGGLGFFLGLEAAREGFVGGGVGLVGVGVVGAEIACFFGGVGTIVASSSGVRRRTTGWCTCSCGLGGYFVLSFAGDGVYVVAGWEMSFIYEETRERIDGKRRAFVLQGVGILGMLLRYPSPG